jgi:hypothetical protein
MRVAHLSADVIAFPREALDERVLIPASRAGRGEVHVPISAPGTSETETLYGRDVPIEARCVGSRRRPRAWRLHGA